MKKFFTLFLSGMALAFGAYAQPAMLNIGDMEQWRTYTTGFPPITLEAPQGWNGLDSVIAQYALVVQQTPKKQVFRTTESHAGTGAARLVSRSYGSQLGVLPGVIANARIGIDINNLTYTLSGGQPVSQRFNEVRAWVKYRPKSTNDSGAMVVQAVLQGQGAGGADSVVGIGYYLVGGTVNAYTELIAPISYFNASVVPDHLQVAFASNSDNNGADSTELLVDDVRIVSTSGISRVLFQANTVQCYPNPATAYLELRTDEHDALTWEAFNLNGQLVAARRFTRSATVSVKELPAGLYGYRVRNTSGELIQTGKFNVR